MKKITLKNIILVLGIVFFYACSSKSIPSTINSSSETNSETEVLKFHRKLNMDSLLNSYNKNISNLDEDGLIYPLDSVIDADSSRVVVIGKFINKKDVFAFDIYGDSVKYYVDFYKFNDKWEKLKSDSYDFWMLYDFHFENFNDDEDTEIVFLGPGNMNGNKQNAVYKFDDGENKFVKSCDLFATELSYDSKSNMVRYQYFGSWYMENIQSVYQWNNNKLIPIKSIEKQYKNTSSMSNGKEWIRYYENPTHDKDTLVLKFKKTYKEKDKKLYDLWENFFKNQ